eukprot:315761_1
MLLSIISILLTISSKYNLCLGINNIYLSSCNATTLIYKSQNDNIIIYHIISSNSNNKNHVLPYNPLAKHEMSSRSHRNISYKSDTHYMKILIPKLIPFTTNSEFHPIHSLLKETHDANSQRKAPTTTKKHSQPKVGKIPKISEMQQSYGIQHESSYPLINSINSSIKLLTPILPILLFIIYAYLVQKYIYLCAIIFGVSIVVNAQTPYTIICNKGYQCRYATLRCATNADCLVTCSAKNSCAQSKIYCPSNDYKCQIDCITHNTCLGAKIFGGGGDLLFQSVYSGYKGQPFTQGIINCPSQKECNVTCKSIKACAGDTIKAQTAAVLNIEVYSYNQVLKDTIIKCPVDGLRGNSNNCNIYAHTLNLNLDLMPNIKIYAVEAFNDINLICNGLCFTGIPPKIYCTEDFSESCTMLSANHSSNKWECISNVSICNDYKSDTFAPTMTTISPTNTPTNTPTESTSTPSFAPTIAPSLSPTITPTDSTVTPTTAPTKAPSFTPTNAPSIPTVAPTINQIDNGCFNSTSTVTAWYTGSSLNLNESKWMDISGNSY